MKQLLMTLAVLAMAISCQPPHDNEDPIAPRSRRAANWTGDTPPTGPIGSYVFWTTIEDSKFDRIEIKVGPDLVGTITRPYLITPQSPTPSCGMQLPEVTVKVKRFPGTYAYKATATKNGQLVRQWLGYLTFSSGQCGGVKLELH